ncbi:GNAT family N-acetyltransferase [Oceanobacillus chungangensis]|uniref:GNAT family N-acetyltransferase n=1 Tax=Oceanobacillus chungangensis TaxID=1229152 RepID=UPI000E215AB1|nr:GNAT family protein [Oceanobacillus chungangensis]
MKLNKILAAAKSRNIGSKVALEKAGLQLEGTLRQNRLLQNVYEDVDVKWTITNRV